MIQPIADRVAQHLEIISKNFQFSTRRTSILVGFIIYCLVLIINPLGRILVRWKSFRNNLEMLCHPICNWLYIEWGKNDFLYSDEGDSNAQSIYKCEGDDLEIKWKILFITVHSAICDDGSMCVYI